MSENQKKILQMVAEGKISVEEATRLLSLISEGQNSGAGGPPWQAGVGVKTSPKYLYVKVEPKEGHACYNHHGKDSSIAEHGKVNVRIPMGLIRAGIKLKALIPPHVVDDINNALREKGIGFDIRDLKDEYLEGLLSALSENEIKLDSDEAEVRIYAE